MDDHKPNIRFWPCHILFMEREKWFPVVSRDLEQRRHIVNVICFTFLLNRSPFQNDSSMARRDEPCHSWKPVSSFSHPVFWKVIWLWSFFEAQEVEMGGWGYQEVEAGAGVVTVAVRSATDSCAVNVVNLLWEHAEHSPWLAGRIWFQKRLDFYLPGVATWLQLCRHFSVNNLHNICTITHQPTTEVSFSGPRAWKWWRRCLGTDVSPILSISPAGLQGQILVEYYEYCFNMFEWFLVSWL